MSSGIINFGTITLLTSAGGTVTLNASTGAATPSANVSVTGAARGYARYQVAGDECKCSLSWSGLPSTLNLTGPGTLQLTNFTFNAGSDYVVDGSCGGAAQYTTNPVIGFWYNPPYGTYYIGATANITTSTKPGTYTGSFTINSSGTKRFEAAIGSNRCTMWPGSEPAENLNTTVNVTATVEWPLSVEETALLDFGKIIRPTANCTAVVATNGSSGGTCSTLTGTTAAGRVKVKGIGGSPISYSIAASTLGSMTLDTFTTSPSGLTTIGANGEVEVSVGATLHVPADKAPGVYTGTYTIEVNYQ
ncbi:hypothetical protein Emin_0451 [Elusimicrobium minutum Pei191]|uniref:DUF4402 domain-containing protein n=1 Tax=Elusimicrobium minutum (strain Pei191) TaxID=445932 RepID=B2KBI6_ELUMP|nr:DUF4402 domain-containing protein [Elusimicrobium minutum]ACC98008.1 hypothetical protein Emin_0451 [Elusimicrobium minutum Pei191]